MGVMPSQVAEEVGVPTQRTPASIPHHFHFVWFGDEPALDFTESWVVNHPDWAVVHWGDDDDWSWMEHYDLFCRASEYAPGFEGQFKSDIARYEILRHYGGVYVDYDFMCQKSIAGLLDNDLPSQRKEPLTAFAAWEQQDVWINNAILGCTPRHPLIEALLSGLPAQIAKTKSSRRPAVMTGPQYLTSMVNSGHKGDGLIVFPQECFYPYSWNELDRADESFPDAYAVHHWNNKRRA